MTATFLYRAVGSYTIRIDRRSSPASVFGVTRSGPQDPFRLLHASVVYFIFAGVKLRSRLGGLPSATDFTISNSIPDLIQHTRLARLKRQRSYLLCSTHVRVTMSFLRYFYRRTLSLSFGLHIALSCEPYYIAPFM